MLKNENKLDEMVDIMEEMHKYVPLCQYAKDKIVPSSSDHESVVVQAVDFHRILLGGDFLTAKRGRVAQWIRANSTKDLDKTEWLTTCEWGLAWKNVFSRGKHFYEYCGANDHD